MEEVDENCLICRADLKAAETEVHTVRWPQLCRSLSSTECERDTKEECLLCPHCFKIVEETKELRCRLEEIESEIRSKVTVIQARIADSGGNLQPTESSRLNSLRQSLLDLLNDGEGEEMSNVQVKLEVQEYDEQHPSPFQFEDVEVTLKDEIDDINLSNVDNAQLENPVSISPILQESEDEKSDFMKTSESESDSGSEYECPDSRASNKVKLSLKRKAKTPIRSRKPMRKKEKLKQQPRRRDRSGAIKIEGAEEENVNSSEAARFKCLECGKGYKQESGLNYHRKVVHMIEIPKFACSICEQIFDRFMDKYNHEKIDHQGSYPCSFCSRKFVSKRNLEIHIVTTHETPEKLHSCHICGKGFTLEISLNRHIRLHRYEKKKPFVCEICDCRWTSEEELSKHLEAIHTPSCYKCSQCDKSVSSKGALARHERTHSGEKPFKCDLCEETFIDGAAKTRHLQKIHSTIDSAYVRKQEVKFYPCDLCGESSFKGPEALQTHKIKMHGESGIICDKCGHKFNTSKGLKRHKMKHTGDKPHPCDLCAAAFLSKWELDNHRRSHTGERPFLCSECGKGFKAKKHLDSHIRGIHAEAPTTNNRHKCPYCDKGYPRPNFLAGHIRQVHTGERPFACHLCSKSFSINTTLRLHLKSHGVILPQGPPRQARSTRARPTSNLGHPNSTVTKNDKYHQDLTINQSQTNPTNPFQNFVSGSGYR